uniref:Uncharacterized protein n=1 Tax=Sphaerodactylus townsendi TaxID=933632 RepID=A0ACB8EQF4_9SAUR
MRRVGAEHDCLFIHKHASGCLTEGLGLNMERCVQKVPGSIWELSRLSGSRWDQRPVEKPSCQFPAVSARWLRGSRSGGRTGAACLGRGGCGSSWANVSDGGAQTLTLEVGLVAGDLPRIVLKTAVPGGKGEGAGPLVCTQPRLGVKSLECVQVKV